MKGLRGIRFNNHVESLVGNAYHPREKYWTKMDSLLYCKGAKGAYIIFSLSRRTDNFTIQAPLRENDARSVCEDKIPPILVLKYYFSEKNGGYKKISQSWSAFFK